MVSKKLTKQQRAFLDDHFMHPEEPQYVVYQRFYRCRENAARANSARLLSSPLAEVYLRKKQEAAAERIQIEEDDVIRRFWQLATFDLADIFTNDWKVKPIQEIPPHARRAITSLSPAAGGGVRITFASRLDALKSLTTMLGYGNRQEQSDEVSMMRDLFAYVQRNGNTGKPGSVRFDLSNAAQSSFDADG